MPFLVGEKTDFSNNLVCLNTIFASLCSFASIQWSPRPNSAKTDVTNFAYKAIKKKKICIAESCTIWPDRFNWHAVDLQQPVTSEKQPQRWQSVSAHSSAPVFLNWQWRRNPGQKEQQWGVTKANQKTVNNTSGLDTALFGSMSRLFHSDRGGYGNVCWVGWVCVYLYLNKLREGTRARVRVTFLLAAVVWDGGWLTGLLARGFQVSLHWLLRTFHVLMENIPLKSLCCTF